AMIAERLVHRIRDVEESARILAPIAIHRRKTEMRAALRELRHLQKTLESESDDARADLVGPAAKKLLHVVRRINHMSHSNLLQTLNRSLLVGAFTLFDAFTGELLAALFALRPDLLNKLGGGTTLIADVLAAESLEDFKKAIIEREVESIRRA